MSVNPWYWGGTGPTSSKLVTGPVDVAGSHTSFTRVFLNGPGEVGVIVSHYKVPLGMVFLPGNQLLQSYSAFSEFP
jgi:hypothetical protein